MKKIMGLILSLMMAANIFAVDWVKVLTSENKEKETYNFYLDFDAREPFYIKCESIEYFLNLKDLYEEVEVCLVEDEDEDEDEDWQCMLDFAFENNYYSIRMEYEDYCADIHINIDGTAIMYIYSGFKNPENE